MIQLSFCQRFSQKCLQKYKFPRIFACIFDANLYKIVNLYTLYHDFVHPNKNLYTLIEAIVLPLQRLKTQSTQRTQRNYQFTFRYFHFAFCILNYELWIFPNALRALWIEKNFSLISPMVRIVLNFSSSFSAKTKKQET